MNIGCCIRDPLLAQELPDKLVHEGFDYEVFRHESALMRTLRHRGAIDLVLMELGGDPGVDESVASWLGCRMGENVPVMLLCSGWTTQRIAQALDAGADDCIAKPVETIELISRIKAVLRRSGMARPERSRVELSGFVLDKNTGTLVDCGVRAELTPREFALAWLFFSSPGMRLAREAISLAIWGAEKDIANRTIEQHVYKLRKKLQLGEDRGVMLSTSYGQGYQLTIRDSRARRMVTSTSRLLLQDAQRNAAAG